MKSREAMRTTRRAGPLRHWISGVALGLALGLLLSDGLAVTGELTKSPAEVVKKYLELDMKGARLEALSREALRPYTTWKEEPAWGHVVVIQGYTVADESKRWEILGPLEVVIPVHFQVLGRMYWSTATFISEPHVEEVRVRVAAVGDRWRIIEPLVPPHVGRQRLVNHVKQALLETTEPSERDALTALRDDLKQAK